MEGQRTHILSKSGFIRGTQCLKSLYLHRFRPDLRDEPGPRLRAVFGAGIRVGLLARELFPGGEEPFAREGGGPFNADDIVAAVARTAELVDSGIPAIYEAAFLHDGVLCFMDIIARRDGGWHAFEVKSSTRVTDTFLLDAALQNHVIEGSGTALAGVSIIHIDRDYVRRGPVRPVALFAVRPVTERVRAMRDAVAVNILRMREALGGGSEPDIQIGEHCFSPYRCDFMGHCWKGVPPDSVFDIARLPKREMFALYRSGITRIADVPAGHPLSPAQRLQVRCHATGEAHVDREWLRGFIDEVRWPAVFMDFESFMPAVPLFEGDRPYQQVPFQYSVHVQSAPGAEPEHREFLAGAVGDPRREFIDRLLADTGGDGSIIVYNRAFEEGVLRDMAHIFPDLRDDIGRRISRLCDLMVPFREMRVYVPAMKGRCSIKNVLPALVPGSGYDQLAVSDGFQALAAYERLREERDIEAVARIRRELLEYCAMDSLAMVKLLERLMDEAGPR
ncbi:MAG: DUF2779 domain-containing protein [Spirochaetes bacterium]|nr:DUF2779 domain-containing protein [Spirochaetota bacterium]